MLKEKLSQRGKLLLSVLKRNLCLSCTFLEERGTWNAAIGQIRGHIKRCLIFYASLLITRCYSHFRWISPIRSGSTSAVNYAFAMVTRIQFSFIYSKSLDCNGIYNARILSHTEGNLIEICMQLIDCGCLCTYWIFKDVGTACNMPRYMKYAKYSIC